MDCLMWGVGHFDQAVWPSYLSVEKNLQILKFFQKTFMFWLKKMKFYDFKKYFSWDNVTFKTNYIK